MRPVSRSHERAPGEARRAMQAARVMAIEDFPYLDHALSAMSLVEAPELNTVACDHAWRLYYSPAHVIRVLTTYGARDLVSDWVHEVMHLLRDHHERWESLGHPAVQQPVFNVAGDALINKDLVELDLRVTSRDVTFATLPASVNSRMTTEAIYLALLDERAAGPDGDDRAGESGAGDGQPTPGAEAPRTRDCGSAGGGDRRGWELPTDDESAVPPGADRADAKGSPGQQDPARVPALDAATAEQIRLQTAQRVREAQLRTAGTVPAGLARWAEGTCEPPHDWRAELRRTLSRAASHGPGHWDYTFTRVPRRRVPGVRMPSMVAPEPGRVAVVIDTSASMSEQDLAQCLAELRAIAAARGRLDVQVIACDTQAHPARRLRDVRDVELAGGGGTDLRAGIEAAVALRPAPQAVILLTDGVTRWPDAPPAQSPATTYLALLLDHVGDWIADEPPAWIRSTRVRAGADRALGATLRSRGRAVERSIAHG